MLTLQGSLFPCERKWWCLLFDICLFMRTWSKTSLCSQSRLDDEILELQNQLNAMDALQASSTSNPDKMSQTVTEVGLTVELFSSVWLWITICCKCKNGVKLYSLMLSLDLYVVWTCFSTLKVDIEKIVPMICFEENVGKSLFIQILETPINIRYLLNHYSRNMY
jgi:hypothetical protein